MQIILIDLMQKWWLLIGMDLISSTKQMKAENMWNSRDKKKKLKQIRGKDMAVRQTESQQASEHHFC